MDSACLQHLDVSPTPKAADLETFAHQPPSEYGWLPVPTKPQHYSLIYVILLGHKKRGFGKGKWNGYGGKPDLGEDMETCARRELKEECNIDAVSLVPAGDLLFCNTAEHGPNPSTEWTAVVHIYVCDRWLGDPEETEEMAPKWYRLPGKERTASESAELDDVPWDSMWPEARLYLPALLTPSEGATTASSQRRVYGRADYASSSDTSNLEHLTDKEKETAAKDVMTAWWFAMSAKPKQQS